MPIDAWQSAVPNNPEKSDPMAHLPVPNSQPVSSSIALLSAEPLIQPDLRAYQPADEAAPTFGRATDHHDWPPPFLDHARLSEAKGWHLLNEITFGAWGITTAGRAALQAGAFATGKIDTLSITSLAPATSEAGLVGAVFAILEAAGTVHLTWKAGQKKSELDQCILRHANGHRRFSDGDPDRRGKIEQLLHRRRQFEDRLAKWSRDAARDPSSQIANRSNPMHAPRRLSDTQDALHDTIAELQQYAIELVRDFEDYIRYEQAANELAQANDNIHALGIALARDGVIQLGGTACSIAGILGKAGVPGVNLAGTGVAGGAFTAAMGAIHVGAGLVSCYQAARRLDDVQAARARGAEWQNDDYRRSRISRVSSAVPDDAIPVGDILAAMSRRRASGQQLELAEYAQQVELGRRAHVQRANEVIAAMLHHREQSFQGIEIVERAKLWWAKFRMAYGGASIGVGIGLIVATLVFGLIPPVAIVAAGLGLIFGTVWLVAAFIRNRKDRCNTNAQALSDLQALAEAQHIVKERREISGWQMRNNRYLAIEGMLTALLDRDRPIIRNTLLKALTELGMDRALIDALELRSAVRLDDIYATDRKTLIDKLRCCASDEHEDALKILIDGMALRSDESILKPLRQLFQDFVEGKTSMRQEYERRIGVFAYLGGKLPLKMRAILRLDKPAEVQSLLPAGEPAQARGEPAPPVLIPDTALLLAHGPGPASSGAAHGQLL